jgi:hypothetical protein
MARLLALFRLKQTVKPPEYDRQKLPQASAH